MTKTSNQKRNAKKRNANGKQKASAARRAYPAAATLDQDAREYAMLMADPCNAKLTRSVFPGANGSFVSRFESDFIAGQDAVSTATTILFTPGLGVEASGLLANSAVLATDTVGFNLATTGYPLPGISFMATTSQYRPVAACLEVYWPGSELTRAGVVSVGLVDAGAMLDFSAGNLATVAGLRQLCQHTERMPENKTTINWRPGPFDAETAAVNGSTLTSGRQSLLMTAAGMPANVGVRVRIVVVYEWWPKAGTGFVATVPAVTSRNSVNEVLHALDRTGNWLINAYQKGKPLLEGIARTVAYGVKRAAPAMLALM